MYMGEGSCLPKEQNSQVLFTKRKPYADTTLESPLNGRRRCTDGNILISQASGQSNVSYFNVFLNIVFVNQSMRSYSGFSIIYLITNDVKGEGNTC